MAAAALLPVATLCLGACNGDPGHQLLGGEMGLPSVPGLPRYQEIAAIPVPGGFVNAAGGNLMLPRVDLSIDTRLGTREVGATYDGSRRSWLWSFDIRYDGQRFLDPSGAEHDCGAVPAGDLVPGTHWIRLDASRMQSLGGLVHEFDAGGRLAAVHWASGDHPRLEYVQQLVAGAMRTTQARQCRAPGLCSPVYDVDYDAEGRVVEIADRAGRRAEFQWDVDGNLAVARGPLDLARGWPGTRYEYRAGSRLTALVDPEGRRVEYEISDNARQVLSVRQPGPPERVQVFRYGQDSASSGLWAPARWTRYVDPLGRATVYRFDHWARLLRVEGPGGDVVLRDWTGYEVSRLELPGGIVTRWEHVSQDEVVRHDPTGNRVHVDFRIHGGEDRAHPFRRPVDRIEDDLGPVEQRHYEDGRLVWVENGEGERTTLSYDGENLPSRIEGPDGVSVGFADYGEHGHPETVSFAGEVETRVYDAVGNLLSRSGLERFDLRPGGEVSRRYDENRNLVGLVVADAPLSAAPATGEISLEVGSDGRPLRISRPFGGDHEFVYDALGRLVERRERVDGVWRTTAFEVDALGRVTAVELPNGMRRETVFDAGGRVQERRALRDGVEESRASFVYEDGMLREIHDSRAPAPERYAYDAAGLPASVVFPEGDRLELGHDLRGRLSAATLRLAGGSVLRSLDLDLDLAGRPSELSEDGVALVRWVHAAGRLAEIHTGNSLVRRLAYDPVSGLPVAATTEHPVQGLVEVTSWSTVASNGVEIAAETWSAGPAAAQTVESYRLGPPGDGPAVEGKRLLAFGDGELLRGLGYDLLGNLAASESGARLHVYNAERNRLLRVESSGGGASRLEYAYDAAGYATSRGGVPLGWTAQGRIASAGDDLFEWDALGRPLRRRVDGVERLFRFGGRVETDAAGTPLRLDLGAVVLALDTGQHLYRHPDFRGNAKLVSDDAGGVVAHAAYGAHGLEYRVGAADDGLGFAMGREVGDLVALGPRLLDPEAGRFLGPDPIFQLVSQFTYTRGNPVWWWDPGGLEAQPSFAMQRARIELDSALAKTVIGLAITSGGVWLALHVPPAAPVVLGLGFTLTLDGGIELIESVRKLNLLDEEERGRAGSPLGGLGQGPPGSGGSPGVFGGPPPVPTLPPPPPPCPGCDAVPGGPGDPTAPGGAGGIGGLGGIGGFGGF